MFIKNVNNQKGPLASHLRYKYLKDRSAFCEDHDKRSNFLWEAPNSFDLPSQRRSQEKRPGFLMPLSEIQKGFVSDLGTPSLPTELGTFLSTQLDIVYTKVFALSVLHLPVVFVEHSLVRHLWKTDGCLCPWQSALLDVVVLEKYGQLVKLQSCYLFPCGCRHQSGKVHVF